MAPAERVHLLEPRAKLQRGVVQSWEVSSGLAGSTVEEARKAPPPPPLHPPERTRWLSRVLLPELWGPVMATMV